jgi:hypothetical protein
VVVAVVGLSEADAPEPGAENFTLTPSMGLFAWSRTAALSPVAKGVFTVADWGVPAVATMLVATDTAAPLTLRATGPVAPLVNVATTKVYWFPPVRFAVIADKQLWLLLSEQSPGLTSSLQPMTFADGLAGSKLPE